MWPKITILGDNPVTINYNEVYNEPGYKGKWIFKDITNKIKAKSKLNTTKIGTYKVIYQFKYSIFNI